MAHASSVSPTKEQWLAMREYIEEMYLVPGLTLNKLITDMRTTYGFDATEAMYKRKFREWGTRNNLRREQKDQLIALALEKHKAGEALPMEDANGAIIPWDRVRRHCRDRRIHTEMWNSLELPERPPVMQQNDHRLQRSKTWLVDQDLDPDSTIALTLYQPRSPLHYLSVLISQVRDFQSWRTSTVLAVAQHTSLIEQCESIQGGFSDTAREDAALNIVNDCLVGFRHLQFGFKTTAHDYFSSAKHNFDHYLQHPSMFVLYAILMLYWNACPDDSECRSCRDGLYAHFRHSCEQNLGLENPLTRIVQQLTSGVENIERTWSIALYSWIINTRGSIPTRAARYTTQNVKLGLAQALQHEGHTSSAITVYQEFLADTRKEYNPLHGQARPTQCRLANLYRLEQRYEEAEAALDALLNEVKNPDDIDEGLIYCHSLRGQVFEETQRYDQANNAYRQAVELARRFEGNDGPLTIMYGRKYYDFLRKHALEIDCLLFESEYHDVMEAIKSSSTCIHTGKHQLILLNTFADAGIHENCHEVMVA